MLKYHNYNEILQTILKSYEVYFDVKKCDKKEIPLVAKCEFHVHNEKYILVKKAQIWATDANEYVYIFQVDNLTKDLFDKCKDFAYKNGMEKINPKPGHMYSYITTLFICNSCEDKVEKFIKKYKLIKNFKFSFHGWMDYRISCIYINNNEIFGNKSGRETTEFLKNLLLKNHSLFRNNSKKFLNLR